MFLTVFKETLVKQKKKKKMKTVKFILYYVCVFTCFDVYIELFNGVSLV